MSVAVVTFFCHQYPSHDPDQKQISIRSCDRTCHTSSCKYFNTYSMGHIDSTFMGKYWLVINIQPYYLPATGDGYEVCTDTYTYDASCFFFSSGFPLSEAALAKTGLFLLFLFPDLYIFLESYLPFFARFFAFDGLLVIFFIVFSKIDISIIFLVFISVYKEPS